MDHFWINVFEYFKDRRGPKVFVYTLIVFAGLFIGGSILYEAIGPDNFQACLTYSWPFVALVILARVARGILQARARWRDRYKSSPLSRDELNKARSKLMRAKQ